MRFVMLCAVLMSPVIAWAADVQDAAELYLRAARDIAVESPAETAMEYPGYPPFSAEWHRIEKAAYEANLPRFELVHQARAMRAANWPALDAPQPYLNTLRRLANQLGDATLHEHLQGRHAAAIERVRDEVHMGEMLQGRPGTSLVRTLVGIGVIAQAMDRLTVVTSGVVLTADPKNDRDLQVATARELIKELLEQRDPKVQMAEIMAAEKPAPGDKPVDQARAIEQLNRVNAERTMAAMSLACHLFKFEKKRWPASLDELAPAYLPRVPVDPWGDGKQTFGYVLVKGGLPDGGDRPLVYCRATSPDGLFFRTDEPQYCYYVGDGSDRPSKDQKRGGQFRDVARWAPATVGKMGDGRGLAIREIPK